VWSKDIYTHTHTHTGGFLAKTPYRIYEMLTERLHRRIADRGSRFLTKREVDEVFMQAGYGPERAEYWRSTWYSANWIKYVYERVYIMSVEASKESYNIDVNGGLV
jgi:hypothetical protein